MYRNFNKYFSLFITFLVLGFSSFAQNSNNENSPYSQYGIGELRNPLNTNLKGMAGISSAYSNEFTVNTDNPASYADLKYTTYEGGFEGSLRKITAGNNTYNTGMATISYVTIGVPLGKYAGMAFGIRPYSRVYYRMSDSADLPGIGAAYRNYTGDGSVNYGFLGFSGRYKGFNIGANFGYLFGTIRNSSVLQNKYDTTNANNADFSNFRKIGGIYYKLGILYTTPLNKDVSIRIGGTLSLKQNVNIWTDQYSSTFTITTGSTVSDTVTSVTDLKGKVVMPMTYSFGAHLVGNDKWMAGIDFSSAKWSQYRSYELQDSVDNSYKISIGGEYTPNSVSLYNYLQRVTYRLGFYYGKDLIKLHNTDIDYYAFTIGASLPFKRSPDRFHLGLEIGKRGTQSNNLISENFYRFSIGMSLNDKWFIKRKYD